MMEFFSELATFIMYFLFYFIVIIFIGGLIVVGIYLFFSVCIECFEVLGGFFK